MARECGGRGVIRLLRAGATMLSLAGLLLIGCSGEDRPNRPNVEVIGGGNTVSVSDAGPESSAGASTPAARGGSPTASAPGKYTPSSNVDPYFAMSEDLKGMRGSLGSNPPNYAAAEELYTKGKNQVLANGTVRALSSLPNDSVHAVFPNGASVYGRP